ncbi:PLP-dependent aminotransferase family protein [Clostridiaceae bacterium HSG29]|nr:PLP-dependent aminotransferase family protein [Clostridiaceae bacterium HSG29]
MNKVVIDWKPDRNSSESLVYQIIQYIKHKIHKGDWLIGDTLPSQRQMAERFNVNRSTIVSAISELNAYGILESLVGKGTFVANNSWSFFIVNDSLNWRQYIDHSFHKANLPTIQMINKYEFDDSIIRLSTGEVSSDLMPYDAFSVVYGKMAQERVPLNYIEPLGLEELRIELCKNFKKWNINISPKEILIVSGSLQALQLIALGLLGRGSRVLVESYSYIKSLQVFEFSGIHMEQVITDNNGPIPWMIKSDSLKENSSILYTIPTFHNPTGRTMNQQRRLELLDWCKKNRLPIIEDDAYRELYFDKKPPLPIKSFDDSGNVLYLGTFSKSLAPGMRIGWIVGSEAIIERLGDIKMQTDYGASSVSQWMMTYMLSTGLYETHLKKLRTLLKLRCETVLKCLKNYFSDIASWNNPSGGFYIWLKLNGIIPTEKLFSKLLEENVLINPGYIYTHKNSSYIRLSYSYASMKDMEKGLIILSKVIRSMIS